MARASAAFRDEYKAGTFDVEAYLAFQMELLARFRARSSKLAREFLRSTCSTTSVARPRLIDTIGTTATCWGW